MSEPRIIKKYPNRRLYDTAISSYITLEDVIRNAKPTILIGTSTRGGAFSRPIVEEMAS